MSSQTPNINLTLPVGSENVSRQIINDNNTKIDTAFGGTAGRELLGYKENGDTASQAISDGSFVVWKGNLYKANGNISQGATLSVSNLTAVSSGGFNDLQGQVDSLSDSLTPKLHTAYTAINAGDTINLPANWKVLYIDIDVLNSINTSSLVIEHESVENGAYIRTGTYAGTSDFHRIIISITDNKTKLNIINLNANDTTNRAGHIAISYI